MSEEKAEKQKVVKDSVYWSLQSVNVNDKLKEKQNMKYLSWSWAWAETKKLYPNTTYVVYENKKKDYLPIWGNNKFGYFVRVSVTINELTHESRLPVMNGAMKAMKDEGYSYTVFDRYKKEHIKKNVDKMSVMEINKTVQRALVKALGMHGLGLSVWKGEDYPDLALEVIYPKKEKEIMEEISLIDDTESLGIHLRELRVDYAVTEDVNKLYTQRAEAISEGV